MLLALYGTQLLIEEKPFGGPLVALGYALLFLSHTASMVLFCALPVLYAFCLGGSGRRIYTLIRQCLWVGLGTALAAVHVLPEIHHGSAYLSVATMNMRDKFYWYENNFNLFGAALFHAPPKERIFWFMSWVTLMYMGLVVICCLIGAYRTHAVLRRQALVWLAFSGVIALFMYRLSNPIWQHLPVLQQLQFPSRWLSVLDACVLFMMGIACAA